MRYYDGEFLFFNFILVLGINIILYRFILVFFVLGFVFRIYDLGILVIFFKVFYGSVFILYVFWSKYD